ncbi:MAG TPA: hypothetical protein VGL26_02115 [Jatrophihabitans sp.]
MTQFSLFGAAVAPPTLTDLDGVLLAGGWWVRAEDGARLSVIVTDRWRADALVEEFHTRGVGCAGTDPSIVSAENGLAVRTGFTSDLFPYAQLWTRGANQGPPPNFVLGAGGLRLWCIAAGRRDELGYLLATAEPDGSTHTLAGAQLARFGVPAVSLTHARGAHGGPGWRVSSAKRMRRLVELVGPAPTAAGVDWPQTS